MIDQDCSQAPGAGLLTAEDTAVQLFQIAALMLGDEQEAVSLVEETVAKVEADPCAEATVAYAEARSLLVHTAMQRMAGLYPEAFAVPAAEPADAASTRRRSQCRTPFTVENPTLHDPRTSRQ